MIFDLNKKEVVAVIGVSKNPEKYGNKVYFNLKNSGYNVYPINPKQKKIDGVKCYKSLKDIQNQMEIDVVITVVKPNVTEKIVKEAQKLGIRKIWMQPGSESQKAINFCKNNKIKVIYNTCIILKKKK